jgi:hypothetical protein
VAEVVDAMRAVLEVHMTALDLTDGRSLDEHAAYSELAGILGSIADSLRTTAERMTRYRDLPMGRHDPKIMGAPEAIEVLERFVDCQQALLDLLKERVPGDRVMLAQMRG